MSHVHLLSSTEAQKELTEAVKTTQGSKRTASWKAAARPSWWIDEHSVTLQDGTTVSTGTFDVNAKRKWRKGHFQAALFLYHQWIQGESNSPNTKEEPNIEKEITHAPRKTRRAKKEEDILPAREPRKKNRAHRKQKAVAENPDVAKPEPEKEVEKEEEIEVQEPARGRRNLRFKNESVIPKEKSPVLAPKTRSQKRMSSSSVESDDSPSPILRRRKATGRRKAQKTLPRAHTPISKRQLKARKARNGKALVRNIAGEEVQRQASPQSCGSTDNDPDSGSVCNRLSGSVSGSDENFVPICTRHKEKLITQVTSPIVRDNRRMSPRLSGISARNSASPDSPIKMRKRLLSEAEVEAKAEHPRTPLQDRNDPSNVQEKQLRKKRRTTDSDDALSDKENRTPPTAANTKSTRHRPARGKKRKSRETEVDPMETESSNKENENIEQEDFDRAAERTQRTKKDNTFERAQIAKVKVEVDHQLESIVRQCAEMIEKSDREMKTIADKLEMEYRMKKIRFSKQILDMPMSKFVNDHGGNIDEWMMHETEKGVNKTFQAIHNGEDPNDRAMGPPKTPVAMSRRAALTKTARKTRRRLADEATAAGLTVRRSQRTAAKVATERTRAMIARTPRTVKKEVTIQVNSHAAAPGRTTRGVRPVPVADGDTVVCSRQELENLGRSIRQQENPVEALLQFTSQLQREAFQTSDEE